MKRIYIFILIVLLFVSTVSISLVVNITPDSVVLSSADLSKNYPIIVLDAGHGGEDGGASSANGNLEKDINLDIALTLEKLLLQSGYKVKMIRNTDTSVHNPEASTTRERKVTDIRNRVKTVNSDKNNILISISVPGVIVECGFLSNPDEAYLLSHEDYRDNMAYCIYLGIVEYIYLNY